MGNLINKIFLTGMIGAGSLAGFNGYGQTEIKNENNDSSESWRINVWMRELYKKDSIGFEDKCYSFLNKKIKETIGEIAYYKTIKKPDDAEIEHLRENEELLIALNKYSCKFFLKDRLGKK